MRIWIDFINSPQVSFFEPLVDELTKEGHEFILTCRDSANTVQLVKQRNWPHQVIGEGVEKSFSKKLMAFPARILNLKKYLQDKAIDVAICQSSFYLPLTAKLLGVPSIYTNDNEHAMGNIPSFLFATKIFVPENLSLKKVQKQGAKPSKTYQYPGIKEGVYLWVKGLRIINERKNADAASQAVYVRPEPQTAQYYSGKLNFLDDILLALAQTYNVVILVRDKAQFEHYSQPKFEKIQVPKEPIPFEKVALNCLMFIGAGGSMTREMSMIGIPTISVYQGELLDVDNFLIQEKYLVHQPDLDLQFVKQMLKESSGMEKNRTDLIEKGKQAYELLKSELINLKK
jgi:predicted glycosyltransferase